MITLSERGLLYKFYQFSYGNWPGENFCSFFWKLVLALLLLPITIFSTFPFHENRPTFGVRVFMGVGNLFAYAFGICFAAAAFYGLYFHTYELGKGLMIIGAAILGLLIVVAVVVWTYQLFFDPTVLREVKQVIHTKRDSVMNKYCPKIKWER